MNEAETRGELINPKLQVAGWGVLEGTKIRGEYHITAGRIKPDGIRKNGRAPTNSSIFFTIFQTFMAGGSTSSPTSMMQVNLSNLVLKL